MDTKKLIDYISPPDYDFVLLKDKNGQDILKIIAWDNDVAGNIEIARVKLSKSQYVRDRYSLEDIGYELMKNKKCRKEATQQLKMNSGKQ